MYSREWLATKSQQKLIEEAENFLQEENLELHQADSVHWCFSFSKHCLIPQKFYQQGKGSNLLENTSRLEKGEIIYSDFWTKRNVVTVYALSPAMARWAEGTHPNCRISHSGYALYCLDQNSEAEIHLHTGTSFSELLITKNGKLQFYNQFAHDVPEDLLYYILFAFEQNRVLAPEAEVHFSGKMEKGDDYYKLLLKYIGELLPTPVPNGKKLQSELPVARARQYPNLIALL